MSNVWAYILENLCNLHTINVIFAMDLMFKHFFNAIFHFLTKNCQILLQQPAASSGQTFSLVDQKNNPIKIKIQVSI